MKISIITVSLNAYSTIERTIKSVIKQNFRDLEYIVIDGGSTDGTVDIIQKYDSSISYWVSEKDDGIYNAMNKGIDYATGDIIGIINSDDWYEDGAFNAVAECFESSGADIVYGDCKVWQDVSKLTHRFHEGDLIDCKYAYSYTMEGEPLSEYVLHSMPFGHPTMFAKKQIYEQNGKYDENYRIVADYDFIIRSYIKGSRFSYIPRTIANFRYGGISTTEELTNIQERRLLFSKYEKYYSNKEEYQDIVQRWIIDHLWLYLIDECKEEILKEIVNEIKNYFIFGAGNETETLCRCLAKRNLYLDNYIVDNNTDRWNSFLYGNKICNPKEVSFGGKEVLIAVADEKLVEQIKHQLYVELGFTGHAISMFEFKRKIINIVFDDYKY